MQVRYFQAWREWTDGSAEVVGLSESSSAFTQTVPPPQAPPHQASARYAAGPSKAGPSSDSKSSAGSAQAVPDWAADAPKPAAARQAALPPVAEGSAEVATPETSLAGKELGSSPSPSDGTLASGAADTQTMPAALGPGVHLAPQANHSSPSKRSSGSSDDSDVSESTDSISVVQQPSQTSTVNVRAFDSAELDAAGTGDALSGGFGSWGWDYGTSAADAGNQSARPLWSQSNSELLSKSLALGSSQPLVESKVCVLLCERTCMHVCVTQTIRAVAMRQVGRC